MAPLKQLSEMVKGGIPPVFAAKRGKIGVVEKTAMGCASTCPNLPQTQVERALKVLAAYADKAHLLLIFCFGHEVWANGTGTQESS